MQSFEFIRVGVDSPEQDRLARAHAARKRDTRRQGSEVSRHDRIFRVHQPTQASRLSAATTRDSRPTSTSENDEYRDAEPICDLQLRKISPVYGALSVAAWPFDPYSPDAKYTHYHFTFYAPQVMGEAQAQVRWATFCKNTVVYHAFQYLSVVHQGILRGQVAQADRRGMLFHKAETMRLLRQMLATLDQHDLEAVLLAMYALVYDVTDKDPAPSRKNILPFVPHMPLACWVCPMLFPFHRIGVYGRANLEVSHFSAINAILQKAGGADKFSSHVGLSLRVASLVAASASGTRPLLPLSGQLDENAVQTLRLQEHLPDAPLGQGFAPHVPTPAYHIFSRICLVDQLLVNLRHAPYGRPEYHLTIGPILLARNQAQHRLLSLSPWSELSQQEQDVTSEYEYECCRQTAILYSTAIIFPIPGETGWYIPQVCHIRELFERSNLLDVTGHSARLVIWSLVICGIAAYRTCHRRFFEDSLQNVLRRLGYTTWNAVEPILKTFLWTDPACEHGAAVLWDALQLEDYR